MVRSAPLTLCGSLSRHPVTLGMRMHQAGYAALGLPFAYVPFAVDDLAGALAGMRALGIRGLGVSMPFKRDVLPLLDRIDDLAARIGAVNTIVNEEGLLAGYNTDASGARRALEEVLEPAGRRAVLIGAGGAAHAVAYALCAARMRVHVVNRTRAKAEDLAGALCRTFGASSVATAGGLEDLADLGGADALVNCSSAGMAEYGSDSPVPETALRPGLVVMDIVYKPLETRLLEAARGRGCRVVHGGRMLLHQACGQFELYTGQPAPVGAMEAALASAIGSTSSA
jgi:shikimate dehydrogenase